MKKLVFIIIALLSLPVFAMAQKQAVGGTIDYIGKNRSVGVSVFYQYRLSPMLRIAPDLGDGIRHNDLSSSYANLNLHMPLNIGTGDVDLYPLGGLNLTRWTGSVYHHMGNAIYRTRNHYWRTGLNLGAGFQMRVSSRLIMKAEAKYVITKDFSCFVSSLGVGYTF